MNVLESSKFPPRSWQRACSFQLLHSGQYARSALRSLHAQTIGFITRNFIFKKTKHKQQKNQPQTTPFPRAKGGGYLQRAAGLRLRGKGGAAGCGALGPSGAGGGGSCPPPRCWRRALGTAAAAPTRAAEPFYPTALNTWRYGKYTIHIGNTGKIKIMPAQYLFLRQNTIEVGWNLTRGDRFLLIACH